MVPTASLQLDSHPLLHHLLHHFPDFYTQGSEGMGGDSDDNHEDEMTEAECTEYQIENPEQFLHSGDI